MYNSHPALGNCHDNELGPQPNHPLTKAGSTSGEVGWDTDLTALLLALSGSCLTHQKLLADLHKKRPTNLKFHAGMVLRC